MSISQIYSTLNRARCVCLYVCLSDCLSVSMSVRLPACLYVCLPVCLYVFLSVCVLCACMCVSVFSRFQNKNNRNNIFDPVKSTR